MVGKLDQSLDEILNTRRKAHRSRRTRNPANATGTAARAPVGGVKKSVKPPNSATKGVPTGPSAPAKESKIIISELPDDVNAAQIKEYLSNIFGPVRRAWMTYNQSGRSVGVATVIFSKADSALKAAKDLDGMLVDRRPIKVEVVLDANNAPAPPAVKSLRDRVAANPKAQPKSATATKAKANGIGKKAANKTTKRGKKGPRPVPKTADELDAEMAVYFTNNNGGTNPMTDANGGTNGKTQAAGTGGEDLGMDEIS